MPPTTSVIRQLLRELSFDGAAIMRYRKGGVGLENVLTAEVLQGLDFLPREQFFRAFVDKLKGNIEPAKATLREQAEQASFHFLPGSFPFRPGGKSHQALTVNSDGIIETPGVYAFVEAKRIKSSSFQPEQLAREFVVAVREAKDRVPLLLLILGKEPPVKIARAGKQDIAPAIHSTLESVLKKIVPPRTFDELTALVDHSVAWITWQTISDIMKEQTAAFQANSRAPVSTRLAVKRIAQSVINAIEGQ